MKKNAKNEKKDIQVSPKQESKVVQFPIMIGRVTEIESAIQDYKNIRF